MREPVDWPFGKPRFHTCTLGNRPHSCHKTRLTDQAGLSGDCIWVDADLATMDPNSDQAYGAIRDGAVALREGRIAWVGPRSDIPARAINQIPVRSAGGGWLTPGPIDCHTHLVHAGSRARNLSSASKGCPMQRLRKPVAASSPRSA